MEYEFRYLEIRSHSGEIVNRFNVTNKSEYMIGKIDDGINRNLNHEEYYTAIVNSNEKLKLID